MSRIISLIMFLVLSHVVIGQDLAIKGTVQSNGKALPYANLYIEDLNLGAFTDESGEFELILTDTGTYDLTVSMLGYNKRTISVTVQPDRPTEKLNISLIESFNYLNEVVVTGTKTFKRKTDSPVIVHVLDAKSIDNIQACNLSESLNFQPGLRVETDCQTCNYTQLRMNGLGGGYSQILINGRPIFSPLTGLYGMEQLPANMIDRIEVVRGGGSSLYGSSAIGGTVNVITKIPDESGYSLNYFSQLINGQTGDHNIMGNATVLSKNKKSGISFFMNNRNRDFYDHNDDNFSELPALRNTSLGTNFFIKPGRNQKLEISLSNLNEYRLGGEMLEIPAYLSQQSEERTHLVWLGSLDYQINFNNQNTSLITYAAWQNTSRDHYTGIKPDQGPSLEQHYANPPYGNSLTQTYQAGLQLNHRLVDFLNGTNVFTFGGEYVIDDVFDEIPAYKYVVDQTTKNLGIFVQSDWEIFPKLNLLAGLRLDDHNLVENVIISPRTSLLFKPIPELQLRFSYGTGFRAPQAFDTDLHIAFAGGGVSRIKLAPDLEPERSGSYSASVNYDKATEDFVAGFTLEGFYTELNNAFFLQANGEDEFGEIFEKRNGSRAFVNGISLELRGNYDQKIQLETGITIQKSLYSDAVSYFEGMEPINDFLRTPEKYGFASLNFFPNNAFTASVNYVYTGPMKIVHYAGSPKQLNDELFTSPSFSDIGLKISYTFWLRKIEQGIEFYSGIKNVLNQYQDDFDIGKNRDSNYIYGPALPRTVYFGIKWKGMNQ